MKEQVKGKWSFGKGQSLNEKVYQGGKDATQEARTHGRKAVGRKEAKGKRNVARENTEHVGLVVKYDTLQRGVEREETQTCTLLRKMTVKTLKKQLTMMRSSLQASCLEQWQEVISTRDKQQMKKANQASRLSVDNNQDSSLKVNIEVKDRRVMKARVTMDFGAAGQRKTSPNLFVAANGKQSERWINRQYNLQKCECCRNFFNAESCLSPETLWCWMTTIRTFEVLEME